MCPSLCLDLTWSGPDTLAGGQGTLTPRPSIFPSHPAYPWQRPGFYVTLVVIRWWAQYTSILLPDQLMCFISASMHSVALHGRLLRRALRQRGVGAGAALSQRTRTQAIPHCGACGGCRCLTVPPGIAGLTPGELQGLSPRGTG